MNHTNIFLNSYQQPENKLTYNFLCLVEYMESQKEFCEFLLDNKYELIENPISFLKCVFSGFDSNPDGLIELYTKNGTKIKLFIENKTYRRALDKEQLENHLEMHCENDNCLLLAITINKSELAIVNQINTPKLLFRTWSEITNKLIEINNKSNSFICTQFINYGKISQEFNNMEIIKNDLIAYINYNKIVKDFTNSNFINKIPYLLDSLRKNFNSSMYGLEITEMIIQDAWGRWGIEFKFNHKKDFGQWFFFGIYYDIEDHEIPFKKKDIPELAFFFDINPEAKRLLQNNKGLKNALLQFEDIGFENNLLKNTTNNDWRFLYKRIPLDEIEILDYNFAYQILNDILKTLVSNSIFNEELF